MSEIWLTWGAILVGIIGLIWSADRFVAGSAAVAHNFGVPKLVVGLTIVSFGTSAPEILVAINAAVDNAGDLAVGNALGSNLANIGLVLAITALIAPLPIQRHLLLQEIPILLAVTGVAGVFLYDARLQVWEGVILLAALVPLMMYMVKAKRRQLSPTEEVEESEDIPVLTNAIATLWFAVGLIALIISAKILVWGAKTAAIELGVSPLIIGLTVIAVGTSLPELAATAMSAIKGHHDIALGNIIGSNIFNILAVMAIPAVINPPPLETAVFSRDYVAMAAITALLCLAIVIDYWIRNRSGTPTNNARLGRRIGVMLLLVYLGYYALLFMP